jgi:hypothetical protein
LTASDEVVVCDVSPELGFGSTGASDEFTKILELIAGYWLRSTGHQKSYHGTATILKIKLTFFGLLVIRHLSFAESLDQVAESQVFAAILHYSRSGANWQEIGYSVLLHKLRDCHLLFDRTGNSDK